MLYDISRRNNWDIMTVACAMDSVLVVDDDLRLLELITDFLRISGFKAIGAESAARARSCLISEPFDCVVVDWMMPNESGLDFVKNIRLCSNHLHNIPIMMLTAVSDIDNKVEGIEVGADDYLTKPFDERELVVRLRSLIKRSRVRNDDDCIVRFGEYRFNTKTCELYYRSEPVHLSTGEASLLGTLCLRPNQPFSREELAKGMMFNVSGRTIDVQITRLRTKIGDDARNPSIIKTVRHFGYMIKSETSGG
jgi:two-component system phosphate regulon response regulator OmpR